MFRSTIYSLLFLIASLSAAPTCPAQDAAADDAALMARASELARESILIDTHIDVPYRLTETWDDISQSTAGGDFDYPRAVKGGLNAPFMSIYIPADYQDTGGAAAFADSLIDMVEGFVKRVPEKFAIAKSPEDVRRQFEQGLMSLPMGMENGAPIEDLAKLSHFRDRGISYITLTHGRANQISDSSYDPERKWQGLSPYGEEVVREMNRLGIMVDVSHVSDSAFYDVMAIAQAPAIASHSSARHFTPGFERNMSDEMIERLAENGGLIMINFGSSFLTEESNKAGFTAYVEIGKYLEENDIERGSEEAQAYIEQYRRDHPEPFADVTDVVDHIDHVVSLTGVDHVGIGSDYDGVGDSLPTGLKDVSAYPNLVFHLLKRGYSDDDIRKILGENLLRVWSEVESAASRLQKTN
ncbi:MAG TPA: dipeptidase [Rhodothermia bacterium]|nr:dipeptidase [Rhodothermia bacterium]